VIFRVILRFSGVISRLWSNPLGRWRSLGDIGGCWRNLWGVLRDRRK
jgi:hypothetical protein